MESTKSLREQQRDLMMPKAKIQRFEDLIAWQKARDLTRNIYSGTMRGDFSKDFGLRDQMRRASVSIMSNARPVK